MGETMGKYGKIWENIMGNYGKMQVDGDEFNVLLVKDRGAGVDYYLENHFKG